MKGNIHIKLKAAFLLVVFYTNTLLGFTSAVQFDLKFTAGSHHHYNEQKQGSSKTTIAGSKDDQYINDKKVKYYISCNI